MTPARGGVPAVAYQGEPGAYGEEAVSAYFGDAVDPCPMPTFTAACAAVAEGTRERGAAAGRELAPPEPSASRSMRWRPRP